MHLIVLALLLYDPLLNLPALVLIHDGLVLLLQLQAVQLLPFLHLVELLPAGLKLLLQHHFLVLEQLGQAIRSGGRMVLPLWRVCPSLLRLLQAFLQILPFVVLDGIHVVSLMEVPDLLELGLLLLEGGQQDLRLIALLHFFVEFGAVFGILQLFLQLSSHLQRFIVLLPSPLQLLLDFQTLYFLLLLLLQFRHGQLPLLFLLPLLFCLLLQLGLPLPPLELVRHDFPHPTLVLLLAEDFLKVHLQVAALLALPGVLSADLLVEVVDLLGDVLTLGPAFKLPGLLTGEPRQGGGLIRQRRGVLRASMRTLAICSRPFLRPWAIFSAEERVMPLAIWSVKLVTSRPRRYWWMLSRLRLSIISRSLASLAASAYSGEWVQSGDPLEGDAASFLVPYLLLMINNYNSQHILHNTSSYYQQ